MSPIARGIVLHPAALDHLLRSPQGAVGRDLLRRAVRVESQAKVNASGRPGPRVRSGRLRASITHQIIATPMGGLVARIGSNVEYAGFVEYGTRAHTIKPRRKRALYWKGAPHPVARVRHPGNRPYPYLRPALRAAR